MPEEIRRVAKSGNSDHVALPPEFMKALGWNRGDRLVVSLHGESMVIRKIDFAKLGFQMRPDVPAQPQKAGRK